MDYTKDSELQHKNSFELLEGASWIKSNKNFIEWAIDQIYFSQKNDDWPNDWTPEYFRPYGPDKLTELPKKFLNNLRNRSREIRRDKGSAEPPWSDTMFKPDKGNNTSVRSQLDEKLNNGNGDIVFHKTLKTKDFQFSHLFEETTKNPLAFNAPWNICRMPRFLDPMTGHECHWSGQIDFLKSYHRKIETLYQNQLNVYNSWMIDLIEPIIEELGTNQKIDGNERAKEDSKYEDSQFVKRILVNFRPLYYTEAWVEWLKILSKNCHVLPDSNGKNSRKKIIDFVSGWEYLPAQMTPDLYEDWQTENPDKIISKKDMKKKANDYAWDLLKKA